MQTAPQAVSLSAAPRTPLAALLGLAALCLAGLVLRLWLGWWMGYLGDLQCWQLWSLDPGEFVRKPEYPAYLPLPNNYPPMYPSVLRVMRWVHRDLHLPGDYARPIEIHFHQNPDKCRPLILYLKIPPILCDLVTACLLFLLGRHFGRAWLGLGVAAFYLFSPAILYDGAYFGQTDTILIMFLVAALWACTCRRSVWLGAMLLAAPLMKAQAVFALPVFASALIAQRQIWLPQLKKLALGALIPVALVAALAWYTGQLRQFHDGYFGIVGRYPLVTVRAFNFWWLLTRPWDKAPAHFDFPRDDTPLIGPMSYRMVGAALFFAALILILWRLHKARYAPYALALALGAAAWAFFNLPTQMHERYSIPAVGMTILLTLWNRKWWVPAILASFSALFNIAQVGYFLFPPSRLLQAAVNKLIFNEAHLTWTVFAVIHILMLPLVLEALWREARPQTAGAAAPPGGLTVLTPDPPSRP